MIAGLFGNHAQQFQALAARASAFHEQFVSVLKAGANTYLTHRGRQRRADAGGRGARERPDVVRWWWPLQRCCPAGQWRGDRPRALRRCLALGRIETGMQAVSGAVANAPAELKTLETSAQAVFSPSSLAAIEAPYQSLITNTDANLQGLGTALGREPVAAAAPDHRQRGGLFADARHRVGPCPSRTFLPSWPACRRRPSTACRASTRLLLRKRGSTTRAATCRQSPRRCRPPPTTSPPVCRGCRPASKPPSRILRRATPPVR